MSNDSARQRGGAGRQTEMKSVWDCLELCLARRRMQLRRFLFTLLFHFFSVYLANVVNQLEISHLLNDFHMSRKAELF